MPRFGKKPNKNEPDYRHRWPTQQTLIIPGPGNDAEPISPVGKVLRAIGQRLFYLCLKAEY